MKKILIYWICQYLKLLLKLKCKIIRSFNHIYIKIKIYSNSSTTFISSVIIQYWILHPYFFQARPHFRSSNLYNYYITKFSIESLITISNKCAKRVRTCDINFHYHCIPSGNQCRYQTIFFAQTRNLKIHSK